MLILANVVFSVKCQVINYEKFYDNLDSTRITTGLLYNKVFPYTIIRNFTGQSDTVVTSSDNWLQLYYELFNSHLTVPESPNISDLCDSIGKDTVNYRVPIGILNMNYNLIKDNSLIDSLLEIRDSVLYDGPNVSESPYTTNHCFAASALITNCPSSSNITFFISDDYLFENTNEDIQYYKIDFGNGDAPVTMYTNDEYTINYFENGNKIIDIKAFLGSGDSLQCKSYFFVSDYNTMGIVEDIPLASYSSTPPMLSNVITDYPENYIINRFLLPSIHTDEENHDDRHYGDYGIWYGCNSRADKLIRKPVIFVEGFDPSNQNSFTENGLLYIANQNKFVLNLLNKGCDVIILNFSDGGASIKDNAMVLRKLIQKINSIKVTDNELVVVGASMGGLVARYALSYMEQMQENHKTRLFISFDTPNQGAYASLAGQHLLDFINGNKALKGFLEYDLINKIKERVDFIDCPAAKEMLVYHHSAQEGKIAKQHQMRTDFLNSMALLPNNGYPQQCRKIAISCGARDSTTQGYNPGSIQLDADASYENALRIRLLITALPDHLTQEILSFSATPYGAWHFLDILGPITTKAIYKSVFVNNTDPYDNCPGGRYATLKSLNDAIEDEIGGTTPYLNSECFIPTVSALDLNRTLLQQWNSCNYLLAPINSSHLTLDSGYCEINDHTITPFDAIYVSDNNYSHITGGGLTPDISFWMDKEINRDNIQINGITFSATKKQFEANKTIVASSTNENGVNITSDSEIAFLAGESIILNPGFCVNNGATFTAKIYQYNGTITYSMNGRNIASSPLAFSMSKNQSITTSINETAKENLTMSILPNPTNGVFKLNVDLRNKVVGLVSIFNIMGKLVFQKEMDESSMYIQLNQPSGVYLVKVKCGNNRPNYCKFIIKKNE